MTPFTAYVSNQGFSPPGFPRDGVLERVTDVDSNAHRLGHGDRVASQTCVGDSASRGASARTDLTSGAAC